MIRDAVAVLELKGEKKGYVSFHQCPNAREVEVTIHFWGLKPGKTHAIHIHQFGDKRNGCKSLGPHFNPHKTTHGSFQVPEHPRHAGDLINNFTLDKNGKFFFKYLDPSIRLRGNKSVIGRSVVVHEGIDDLGLGDNSESLETGNAGGRMMCGIIGIANS